VQVRCIESTNKCADTNCLKVTKIKKR
jgi:hypothetical protein